MSTSEPGQPMNRRRLLQASAALAAAGTLAATRTATAGAQPVDKVVPLPSPAQVRADYQTMVDFGPRLCGTDAHNNFTDWIEREFRSAGLQITPCDSYAHTSWSPANFGLDVLDGSRRGTIRIPTVYNRSAVTGAAGVTGPLVYGGQLPLPSISPGDAAATAAGLAQYPQQLASWMTALAGRGRGVKGSILVVDLTVPLPIPALPILAIQTHLQWQGHSPLDWGPIDFKRAWFGPWPELKTFARLGVKAVVMIVDASYEMLEGNGSPHQAGDQPIPGLIVDRKTGNDLRRRSALRPNTRVVVEATRKASTVRSVTGVLPGRSDEVAIINSHTDGQNVFEENGAVAVVHMARHFASLPPSQRLDRTLVFAAWPGHMSSDLPEAAGWLDTHPDLARRAAIAVTIEHLGAREWIDTANKGFHATGENEIHGIWTTQGPTFRHARDALVKANLGRHALLRPPIEITPGSVYHERGIPHIAGISGPTYLLKITNNGEMDKLDPELAARQTAFYADTLRRTDSVSAAALRTGDPTLGKSDNPFPGKTGPFAAPLNKCTPTT